MNKRKMIGTVSFPYNKTKKELFVTFDSGKCKLTFQLNVVIGNNTNKLICEVWKPDLIEKLFEDDLIQLTSYMPKNDSWQNKNTGVWQSKSYISVDEFIILSDGERSDSIVGESIPNFDWDAKKGDNNEEVNKDTTDALDWLKDLG